MSKGKFSNKGKYISDDDLRRKGRHGGQVAYGGDESGDDLTLRSTSNATKGFVLLADDGGKVGIGLASPTQVFHMYGTDQRSMIESDGVQGTFTGVVPEGVDNRINFIGYTSNDTFSAETSMGGFQVRITAVDPNPLKTKVRFIVNTGDAVTEAMTIADSGQVGIGATTPTTSAQLDVDSTTGALLVPRMTTTQRDALTAANGMIIYNTTTNAFNFYENGSWVSGSGLA